MQFNYAVILLAGSTIGMWGLWGFWGKIAMDKGASPLMIFLAEVSISFVIGGALFVRVLAGTTHWNKGLNIYGFLSGAALAVGLLTYYYALNRADASVIVPLTALYPAVSVLLCYALLGERLLKIQWVGLVLAMVGAFLLCMMPVRK
jgi:bacterial/archaeal transporter family protein